MPREAINKLNFYFCHTTSIESTIRDPQPVRSAKRPTLASSPPHAAHLTCETQRRRRRSMEGGGSFPWVDRIPVALVSASPDGQSMYFARPASTPIGLLLEERNTALNSATDSSASKLLAAFLPHGSVALPRWMAVGHVLPLAGNQLPLLLDLRSPLNGSSGGDMTAESTFFHSLKQAFMLRFGTCAAVSAMPLSAKSAMFRAACTGDADAHEREFAALLLTVGAQPSRVPLRILLDADSAAALNLKAGAKEGAPPSPFTLIQRPVSIRSEMEPTSAQEAVAQHLGPSWSQSSTADLALFLYGVRVPFADWSAVPIEDIWREYKSPDGWLYFCCVAEAAGSASALQPTIASTAQLQAPIKLGN